MEKTTTTSNYAQTLLELVNAQEQAQGSIALELTDEKHYRCVSGMFGGEEHFSEIFPLNFKAAQRSRVSQTNSAGAKQGFTNTTKLLSVFYDAQGKELHASGYSNLTGVATTLYHTMFVYKNGVEIGAKTEFVYNTNFSAIEHSVPNVASERYDENDFTIVLQSSWKPINSSRLMSSVCFKKAAAPSNAVSGSSAKEKDTRTFSLGEVVSSITVSDPGHKRTSAESDITVAYGRRSSTEALDYEYPESRSSTNEEFVFLDNSGTVTLVNGAVFHSGAPDYSSIVLDHPTLGSIWYTPDLTSLNYTKLSATSFKWSIDKDWKNTIPQSVIAGNRSYAYNLNLSFFAIAPNASTPEMYSIDVSSHNLTPNPHFQKISNVKMMWGCLAKGTLVKMADGSLKPIEDILKGELLMGADGQALPVEDTISGNLSEVLRVVTDSGKSITATESHPFMTDSGMKPLIKLCIGDNVLMDGGEYDILKECYPLGEKALVYNLDTTDDLPFICDGFVVGGFTAQNTDAKNTAVFQSSSNGEDFLAEAKKWKELQRVTAFGSTQEYGINRNSLNALKTYGDSYFLHSVIPDVHINGGNHYTIEVFFYLNDVQTNSVLYSQPNAFTLGVDKGRLYFDAPGFCTFTMTGDDEVIFEKRFYFVAFTFDGSKVAMYVQGHKVFEKTAAGSPPHSQEQFEVGRNHTGYICTVRVFDKALTADAILYDNTNVLKESENCAAWLVFSERQPRDKSKSCLTISKKGVDAKVVNLVACTGFSGNGHVTAVNRMPTHAAAFTVLGKVFPKFSASGEMTLITTRKDSGGYAVILRKQIDLSYRLVVQTDFGEASSTENIEANRWLDFAVTLSDNTITLYVNGKAAPFSAITAININGDNSVVLGAGYQSGTVSYANGFIGYIDYIAEFDSALDAGRIEGYAVNPPYIFDEGLTTSLYLNVQAQTDMLYDEALNSCGDAGYMLAESTNPLSAPKGVEYYIPTQQDPMWDTLSREDQWALQYYCEYSDEISSQVLGMTGGGAMAPLAMTGTSRLVMRRSNNLARNMDMPTEEGLAEDMQPLLRRSDAGSARSASTEAGNGFSGGVGTGAAASAGTGAAGAAGAGGGSGTAVGLGIVGGAFAIPLLAVIISEAFAARPASATSKLKLESLSFNNNGDCTKGSLNCRVDLYTSIPPVTVPDTSGIFNMTGAFVLSKIADIQLVAVVTCSEADFNGSITAQESSNGIFGSLSKSGISMTVGETKSITFNISSATLKTKANNSVKLMNSHCIWRFEEGTQKNFMANSNQAVYTVINEPLSPWESNPTAYVDTNIEYVWTSLLDICCKAVTDNPPSAGTPSDKAHMYAYTRALNRNSAFKYDTTSGASAYTTHYTEVKLQKYITGNASTVPNELNCTDCAAIVAIEALASGIDCTTAIMEGVGGFKCNEIQAIGCGIWEVPFGYGFSYHQVAVMNPASLSKDEDIYDACLELDANAYPGLPQSTAYSKLSALPTGFKFAETAKPVVDVPTTSAYSKPYYRERLVKDGEICSLLNTDFEITGISRSVTANDAVPKFAMNAAVRRTSNVNEYLDSVRKRFDLPEPETFGAVKQMQTNRLSTPVSNLLPAAASVTHCELTEDYGANKVYEVAAFENNYTVDIHDANNPQEANDLLIVKLATVSNPRLKRIDMGDSTFAVDDCLFIAQKGTTVISVKGAQCLALARELFEQI